MLKNLGCRVLVASTPPRFARYWITNKENGTSLGLFLAFSLIFLSAFVSHNISPFLLRVKDSAASFNANPRQIKRYINLFRFYATLRYAYKLDGIYDDPKTVMPTDAALAKFVAHSIRCPQAIGWLWAKNDGDQPHLTWLEQKVRKLAESDKNRKKADASRAAYLKPTADF